MFGVAFVLVSTACSPNATPVTPTPTRISIADLGLVTQAPVYIAMHAMRDFVLSHSPARQPPQVIEADGVFRFVAQAARV
jgi:hypothetical protein